MLLIQFFNIVLSLLFGFLRFIPLIYSLAKSLSVHFFILPFFSIYHYRPCGQQNLHLYYLGEFVLSIQQILYMRLHFAVDTGILIDSMNPAADGPRCFTPIHHMLWHKFWGGDKALKGFEFVLWNFILVVKDELLEEVHICHQ